MEKSTIYTKNTDIHEQILFGKDIVREQPHQLECLEESEIFEASTHYFDEKSCGLWKGDLQT